MLGEELMTITVPPRVLLSTRKLSDDLLIQVAAFQDRMLPLCQHDCTLRNSY